MKSSRIHHTKTRIVGQLTFTFLRIVSVIHSLQWGQGQAGLHSHLQNRLHTVHEEASEILGWRGKLRVPFCFSRREARRGTGSETQTHGGAQRGAKASAAKQGGSVA